MGELAVLILENDPADFELIKHELFRSGFTARCQRAETETEFLRCLADHPDIILADFSLNGFDALRALEQLKESGLLIPLIVLTGTVGEDTMVECMKRGAADYLLKDRFRRLGPAITRALGEAELQRQKRDADLMLRQKNIELQEQYHQAQAASRMKSAFLANMSHELRTPLNSVIGFTELLAAQKVGSVSKPQLDLLHNVVRNAKHLLGLINGILDMATVESGMVVFRAEPVRAAELIAATLEGVRVLAEQKQIELALDSELPAGQILLLDPQRLRQVVLNYVSNALKFTPAKGRVRVRLARDGEAFFRLTVEDTGIGIAPEDIGWLFQDFHQLDNGMAKKFAGTGLGLALTKRLVEAQGGKVGVASVPGKGSAFFATLPYDAYKGSGTDAESSMSQGEAAHQDMVEALKEV